MQTFWERIGERKAEDLTFFPCHHPAGPLCLTLLYKFSWGTWSLSQCGAYELSKFQQDHWVFHVVHRPAISLALIGLICDEEGLVSFVTYNFTSWVFALETVWTIDVVVNAKPFAWLKWGKYFCCGPTVMSWTFPHP